MAEILHKPDTGATNGSDRPAQAPKGIVDPVGAARRIRLVTYPPAPALKCFVDYFWLVEWDMGGRPPEIQRVLPFPNAHLVFDKGRTAIHGVVRGVFDRTVEGAGRVLGIRFKPGGLRPFIDQPLSRLTDRTMPVDGLLKIGTSEAEQRVLSQDSDEFMVGAAESMLIASLPSADPRALLAGQAVSAAAAVNGPTSVGALAELLCLEERSLQRLFSNYVGVSPKWVIQRFRLQEATWRLAQHDSIDLSTLADQLGFFARRTSPGTSPGWWASHRWSIGNPNKAATNPAIVRQAVLPPSNSIASHQCDSGIGGMSCGYAGETPNHCQHQRPHP